LSGRSRLSGKRSVFGGGKQFLDRADPAFIDIAHEIERVKAQRLELFALLSVDEHALQLGNREREVNGMTLFDDDTGACIQPRFFAVELRKIKSDPAVFDA